MKAILKKVAGAAEVIEVDNTLKELQKAVGGNIQTLPFGSLMLNLASVGRGNLEKARAIEEVILICDEDGRIKGKAPNISLPVYVELVGDILFVGNGGEDFRGLTDGEVEGVLNLINTSD